MKTSIKSVLNFPLIKIIAGVLWCMGAVIVAKRYMTEPLLYRLFSNRDMADTIKNCLSAVVLVGAYYGFSKYYERKKAAELSAKQLPAAMTGGLLLGSLTISLSIFILYLLGCYTIVSISTDHYSLKLFTLLLVAALMEDLINRALIIRVLNDWLGTYWTLLIAMLIEMMHVFNPNANGMSLLFDLIWGFTMAMLFIYSQRVWLPFFFHVGWNFAQLFYGSNLTGLDSMGSIMQSRFEGPVWLTGGAVGIEGSVFTMVFLLLIGLVFFWLAKKEGKIRKRRSVSSMSSARSNGSSTP